MTTALLTLAAAGVRAQANVPGPNGQITFSRPVSEERADVFTANPDGSHEQQVPLAGPDEAFGGPIWSPDGTKLLISHTFRVDANGDCCLPFRPAIVNPDGSDFTQLTMDYAPQDMDCQVWSADQTRLLCGFGGDQPGAFSVRSSDGGDPIRLTTAGQGEQDSPTDISPDGQQFLFIHFRPGPLGAHDRADQAALFTENIDGTGLRQVVPYGVAHAHEIAGAHWSPDGQQIISATTQGLLFVAHPDGAGLSLIHLQTGNDRYFAFEPAWSPDGTRIIFCMFINGQEDIYTANPDGSEVVQVTDTPEFENAPNWGTHRLAS